MKIVRSPASFYVVDQPFLHYDNPVFNDWYNRLAYWLYSLTVMENMRAFFLEREGWAKRVCHGERLSFQSLSKENEKNNAPARVQDVCILGYESNRNREPDCPTLLTRKGLAEYLRVSFRSLAWWIILHLKLSSKVLERGSRLTRPRCQMGITPRVACNKTLNLQLVLTRQVWMNAV